MLAVKVAKQPTADGSRSNGTTAVGHRRDPGSAEHAQAQSMLPLQRGQFPPPEVMLPKLQTAFRNKNVMLLFDPAIRDQADACCSSCAGGGDCEVQRSEVHDSSVEVDQASATRIVLDAGQPLDTNVRSMMEGRFAHDFANVRIHVDDSAAATAKALHARAFTLGSDIVFGKDVYAPSSREGLHVVAHELAHVVQQSGTQRGHPANDLRISEPEDQSEIDAERAAADVMAGLSTTVAALDGPPSVGRLFLVEQPAAGCGVCQGPQAAGTAAHRLVQMDFEAAHPLGLNELHVAGPGGEGFLDLAIATPSGLQIGEIKPAHTAGYLEGESDMLFYLTAVAAAFPGKTVKPLNFTMAPWVSIFPNPIAGSGCPPQGLFVNPPINGVYGYWCEPTFKDLVKDPACKCKKDEKKVEAPAPVPVLEKKAKPSSSQRLFEFVEGVIAGGIKDIEAAGREFLQRNPDLVKFVMATGILTIVAMIVQDIVSLGAGIADNPVIIAIVTTLMRIAQELQPVSD